MVATALAFAASDVRIMSNHLWVEGANSFAVAEDASHPKCSDTSGQSPRSWGIVARSCVVFLGRVFVRR